MSVLPYEAALAALQERGRFGIRLGLGRTRALLRELGNPHHGLRGALVAGTNGKGSVLALASAALREAGYRVGETPKPHLVSYRERLQVDGRLVPRAAFARLVAEALPVADRVARRLGDPTEFELLTAVAFRWFAEESVDVALIEVGLGGRLDATHCWDGGVAVITNVDLDHTAQLGPTIPLIAREKAAIIERVDLAVTGATGAALAVIRRRARRMGAPLTEVAPAPVLALDLDGIVVRLDRLGETRIGLRGRHQAANASVAHALLDALASAQIAVVPDEARRSGFAAARWPGRLELLEDAAARAGFRVGGGGGQVVLDGAHNPAGATVLAAALDDLRPFLAGYRREGSAPITLLTAAMADKDIRGIVAALAASPAVRSARMICTQVDLPRAAPAEMVAATWRAAVPGCRPQVVRPVEAALRRSLAEADGPVVVCGSLYLVGAVRGLILGDPDADGAAQ